jgi:poly [ADP-ribose] polymerase
VSVWFHVPCFFIKEKGKLTSTENLGGYDDLRLEDQLAIAEHIKKGLPEGFVPPSGSTGGSTNVAGAGSSGAPMLSGVTAEMLELSMENNKKVWALKDKLEKDDVPNKQLKALCELNNMPSIGGRQDLVNRVSDAMLFGVATCPVCRQRDMSFQMGQYICKAENTFGLCAFKGLAKASGGRVEVAPIVTDDHSEFAWIKSWNQPLLTREKRIVTREAIREYTRDAGQPLKGMKFAVIGSLERDFESLQALVIDNGGSFSNDIQADIDYVLTTYEDILRAQQTSQNLPRENIAPSSPLTSKIPSKDANNTETGDIVKKTPKQVLEEKRAAVKAKRMATSEKLRMAMDLKLALVTETLLDQLLVTFGFDQSLYLLGGQLPPIAHAKLATPASIFPSVADTKEKASGISSTYVTLEDIEREEAKKRAEEAASLAPPEEKKAEKPSGPYWHKKPTTSAPMTSRGIVDNEAKCPNGAVYREVKPKVKVEKKEEEPVFKATEFESLKEKVEEKEDYEVYDRMLSYADVTSGLNKWYRLQIIDVKGTGKGPYKFFTRWGRVGEPGNWTSTNEAGIGPTLAAWEKKWKEKTGNAWSDRENFVKKPGLYSPVDVDEEEEKPKAKKGDSNDPIPRLDATEDDDYMVTPSFLDPKLKKLVDMIFDPKMLEKSMTDLKIDIKKMPLGKLKRDTLIKGYSVLKEIEGVLQSTDADARFRLPSLSSQFYTLVAHDFGRNAPDNIDSFSILRLKMKQIETLLDIMIAAQMLNESDPLVQTNPTDLNYQKLKVELTPLSSYTRDYKMVQRFVSTGYNPKSLGTSLSVVEVFKVDRHGENDRFDQFRSQRPRKLLWHGSRVCNYVGILSSGLRIAPPEAPASGYMFGKAIYLSDLVEKSAPYCYPDPETGMGLLLICDTALGESLELNRPEFITKLPDGKSSAKALAKFQPDPTKAEVGDEKVIVPIGAPTPTNLPDVFLEHSEYMVYDAAQVRLRYLVQVQFAKTGTLTAPK